MRAQTRRCLRMTAVHRATRIERILLIAPLALLSLVSSAGAQIYPSPTPDFAHPSTPHFGDPRFSPVGGNADRPILVIYARWDDVDYPAGFDAATVASRFFGTGFPSTTFPSVGDYYRRLSFNDLFLFPAAETQGTPFDGIVQVSVPGTKAAFFTLSERARNKRMLELADPFVDYASFDSNGNGALSDLEIIVNVLEASTLPLPQGCGITRGVDAVSLDGTNLGALSVAMDNTATNLITIIHENAHVALGLIDLYGFDVGNFDIGAATCGGPDAMLFAPSAWYKLHWGWISPTVVTQDGYYNIRRADTTGDAFILYDPDRGTDDYFVVENRRPTPGTYDQSVADDGLIIWRIADAALGISTPIGLMRPQPNRSAWNAADPVAPQRTMSQPWTDGTPTTLAVRAIGAAGEVMRAYFDVRGPGVLVDTYPVDLAGPVRLTAAGSNVIDVPVMNTGEEACDNFVFEPVQLPPAWTMSPDAHILCAGETSFARMIVTPDANAHCGVYTIAIRGRSMTNGTVMSESPLLVEVVDITAPSVTMALDRTVLWPPNHKLVDIEVTVSAVDACDPNPTLRLVAITSNEPDNGLGDGDTPNDIQGASFGTADTQFQLRAERAGGGAGRRYRIHYQATDSVGNTTNAFAEVRVPHSQSGGAHAASGFNPEGDDFAPDAQTFALVVCSVPRTGNGDVELLGPISALPNALELAAGAIDLGQAYVGNGMGVITPLRAALADANGDGLSDLVCFYDVGAVRAIQRLSSPEDGAIGLHYSTLDNIDYLVPDIFRLGSPTGLPTLSEIPLGAGPSGSGPALGSGQELPAVANSPRPQPVAEVGGLLKTELVGVYPNPLRGTATVEFSLASEQPVDLAVYDVRGSRVATLANGIREPGRHLLAWDGRDPSGRSLNGIYFVRFAAGAQRSARKIAVMP